MRTIYDPIFTSPPTWAGPVREPPFRARGLLFQSDIARVATTVPGGLDAVLTLAANPALTAFLKQSFATHRYYDVVPISIMSHIAARLRGITLTQWAREAATDYVARSLEGVTGLLLKTLSVETLANWLPKASSWFNDFGVIETRATGPQVVRVTRTGLPTFMVLGWAIAGIEFTEVALRQCGAKHVRVYPLAVETDGTREGTGLHRVSFEITWSA